MKPVSEQCKRNVFMIKLQYLFNIFQILISFVSTKYLSWISEVKIAGTNQALLSVVWQRTDAFSNRDTYAPVTFLNGRWLSLSWLSEWQDRARRGGGDGERHLEKGSWNRESSRAQASRPPANIDLVKKTPHSHTLYILPVCSQRDVMTMISNLNTREHSAFRSVIHIGITSNHLSCSRATRAACLPFYAALIRLNGARISAALVIDRH